MIALRNSVTNKLGHTSVKMIKLYAEDAAIEVIDQNRRVIVKPEIGRFS